MQINYDNFQFLENDALYYKEEPIADFNLRVVDKKVFLGLSKARGQPSYLVEVTYTDSRISHSEWVNDLKNLDLFELFEINDCFLSAENRKLLSFKLMHEASGIPKKTIIDSHEGLQIICEVPVYVLGEHIFYCSELPPMHEITTHCAMQPVPYTDRKKILNLCKAYISLLPGTSEILFYIALFAVIKPFLSQLKIFSGFLFSLVAPSGHLKTTLVRSYALWLDPKDLQEVSFCSLQRDQHILKALDCLPGQNFLIDDLHQMSDANEKRRQERRLDIVSRHVDATLDCANVILTGETMEKMGIFSCMDRIFQVRIPKMDAKQIEKLKERVSALAPGLMPSAALMFARSLMNNYDAVLKDIQDFYQKNSINSAADGYATRMHRHALFIRMTAYLFEKYVFWPEMILSKDRDRLDDVIQEQIYQQELDLQKIRLSEEPRNYIVDFYELIAANEKYIKICSNIKEYQYDNSGTSCLLYHGRLYITTNSLKNAFFRCYEKYVPIKGVIDELHKEGILEEEPASKGRQKNFLNQKHYVISMCFLISYLRKNGYPVSEEYYEKFVKQYL